MTKGRLIFLAILIALAYFVPKWMSSTTAPQETAAGNPILKSLPVLQSPTASDDQRAAALDRALGEAAMQAASLTPQQNAMFDDLRLAKTDAARARLAGRLLESFEGEAHKPQAFTSWSADIARRVAATYRFHREAAQSVLWFVAALIVFVSFAGVILSWTHLVLRSTSIGFRLARGWLVILSFLAIAFTVVTRTNPWAGFPFELLFAPLAVLVGCGFALRLVDFNYPVWNSIVRGSGAPLISMAVTAIFLKFVS